ncbi:MAG: lysylphosphatidylglycerol synthase transmembrane domain-containing protein [Solirubrobacterales bacterium]
MEKGEGEEADRPEAEEEGPDLPTISTQAAVQSALLIVILVVGINFLLPKLAGFGDAITTVGTANPFWVGVALVCGVLSFVAYIALFRSVVGGHDFPITIREAYEINMAGFAATLIFSAGGAGGVVLTYWALRQGGMGRRDVATRMVAFIALHYIFYPLAIIVFGVLLKTGVLSGSTASGLTIVPAAVAGLVMLVGLAVALVPADIERRLRQLAGHRRGGRILTARLRDALRLLATPGKAGLAFFGAVGFWAANVGILWASFLALGVPVTFGVVVLGFFIGLTANLIPFVPAGVGAVDAGMIGTFVLFGLPEAGVFAAVLIYRLIAFWLPIPFGVVAFVQLRQTVKGWKTKGLPIDRNPSSDMAATGP